MKGQFWTKRAILPHQMLIPFTATFFILKKSIFVPTVVIFSTTCALITHTFIQYFHHYYTELSTLASTNCHLKLRMIMKSLRSLIYFSAFIFVLFFTQIKGPPKGESVPIASWQSFGNESETTTRWYEVVGERKEEQVQSLINGLNGEKGGKKAPSS